MDILRKLISFTPPSYDGFKLSENKSDALYDARNIKAPQKDTLIYGDYDKDSEKPIQCTA